LDELLGPCNILADAPLERIPIFVRDGAVIPMWPEAPLSTMDYQPRSIELHLYVPAANGVFTSQLEEDDGSTFSYRDGHRVRTSFILTRDGSELYLLAQISGEGYAEFARKEFVIVFHGQTPTQVQVGGEILAVHHGAVSVTNHGEPFTMTANLGKPLW
jgi:alpha-glucosidase